MKEEGFTLIEIILTIVLVGIIAPGIMIYFIQGVKDSAIPQRRTTAIFLAEALMEEIKSKRWDESAAINSPCANASVIGSEPGEARINYDDIDDFNNMNNTPPRDSQDIQMTDYPGFTQQAAISYVTSADPDTPVAGPTCYKRVQVDVNDATNNEKITLVTMMAYY